MDTETGLVTNLHAIYGGVESFGSGDWERFVSVLRGL